MPRIDSNKPRGVLKAQAGARHFRLTRYAPSPEAQFFIEHYWIVNWDLRGKPPYVSETLPHPSMSIVIEKGHPEIPRIIAGKFSRRLVGRGRVFGIKFRPATFQPLLGASMARLARAPMKLQTLLGRDGLAFRRAILAEPDERRCVELAERFLADHLPEPDEEVARVRDLVERMAIDRDIVRVEQAAALLDTDARGLQRLFRRYVGLTPKWVIQRYRLHEAAEALARGPQDMAKLAVDLGYFDQAHFIKDFKAIIGCSPGRYARVA